MTKSELIERLASQHSHIPAKAVEDAVKEMLEHMASTLAQGERIEIRGFGSFSLHYRAPRTGVTRKQVIKSNWKVNTFHTLSRVKNYATAPIFTVKFYRLTLQRTVLTGAVFCVCYTTLRVISTCFLQDPQSLKFLSARLVNLPRSA